MSTTTGWPPGLLQDDCKKLSQWFASRIDARHVVRQVCREIRLEKEMSDKQPEALRLAQHLENFRSFPDDLAAAAELRRLYAENEALKLKQQAEAVPPGFVAFARDVLADFPHGFPDSFDLNDLAIKHGLLTGKTVAERCGELCNCAEYHGEDELKGGVTCYHRHAAIAQQKGHP